MFCLAVKLPPARVPLDEVKHGLVFGGGAFRLVVVFNQVPELPHLEYLLPEVNVTDIVPPACFQSAR